MRCGPSTTPRSATSETRLKSLLRARAAAPALSPRRLPEPHLQDVAPGEVVIAYHAPEPETKTVPPTPLNRLLGGAELAH